MVRNYKELIIFKKAYAICIQTYHIIKRLPAHESHNIIDQMRRAAVSIPINIAEGCSSMFNKILLSQLDHSYGSAKELEVLFMLCRDLKYIKNEEYEYISNEIENFKISIYKFMIHINNQIDKGINNSGISLKKDIIRNNIISKISSEVH